MMGWGSTEKEQGTKLMTLPLPGIIQYSLISIIVQEGAEE